jgi:hypothetical protein
MERTEVRVVTKEMGHRVRVSEIVERHDLQVRSERLLSPEEVPPDAAEPVDSDANSHSSPPFLGLSDSLSSLTAVGREPLEEA